MCVQRVFYLIELLRERLGFEGVVCSDWFGVGTPTEQHRIADSMSDAITQTTIAELDISSVGSAEDDELLMNIIDWFCRGCPHRSEHS